MIYQGCRIPRRCTPPPYSLGAPCPAPPLWTPSPPVTASPPMTSSATWTSTTPSPAWIAKMITLTGKKLSTYMGYDLMGCTCIKNNRWQGTKNHDEIVPRWKWPRGRPRKMLTDCVPCRFFQEDLSKEGLKTGGDWKGTRAKPCYDNDN